MFLQSNGTLPLTPYVTWANYLLMVSTRSKGHATWPPIHGTTTRFDARPQRSKGMRGWIGMEQVTLTSMPQCAFKSLGFLLFVHFGVQHGADALARHAGVEM